MSDTIVTAMILHRIAMWTHARKHPLDDFDRAAADEIIANVLHAPTQKELDRVVDSVARKAFLPLGVTFNERHFDATWQGNSEDTARILPGDRVRFSDDFLCSIGAYAVKGWSMKGTVIALTEKHSSRGKPTSCAYVDWGDGMACDCTCGSTCKACHGTNKRYYQALAHNLIVLPQRLASPNKGE